MLRAIELESGYGQSKIISGVNVDVKRGEIVSIIGPNGSGKSTLLRTICRLIPIWNGEIYFNDELLNDCKPSQNVARGLIFAPQGSRVFSNLTVEENFKVAGFGLSRTKLKSRILQVMELFPSLSPRTKHKAGTLSGGQQHILSLARALIPFPKLIILDEPSLGLSPNLVRHFFEQIVALNKSSGVAVLIVEQRVREVLLISNRTYVMKSGRIVHESNAGNISNDYNKLREFFL